MHEQTRFVLAAAVFLVVAAVMVSLPDLTRDTGRSGGFGPSALPFRCDFTRQGAGPDVMDGRFTLTFDETRAPPFAYCASLTRGTEHRPRTGGTRLCFDHITDVPQDLWRDTAGGALRITRGDGAVYIRRERAPGVPVSGPYSDIPYTGTCED